jgi:hypothetical protein
MLGSDLSNGNASGVLSEDLIRLRQPHPRLRRLAGTAASGRALAWTIYREFHQMGVYMTHLSVWCEGLAAPTCPLACRNAA